MVVDVTISQRLPSGGVSAESHRLYVASLLECLIEYFLGDTLGCSRSNLFSAYVAGIKLRKAIILQIGVGGLLKYVQITKPEYLTQVPDVDGGVKSLGGYDHRLTPKMPSKLA